EPPLLEADLQVERALVPRGRRELVLLQEVEDRHRPFVLDVGVAAHHATLVEVDLDDPLHGHGGRGRQPPDRLSGSATERACASSPSASASVIAAGPIVRKASAPQLRIDVRFRKSCTPSPEENRALRAVGSTWLGPPT